METYILRIFTARLTSIPYLVGRLAVCTQTAVVGLLKGGTLCAYRIVYKFLLVKDEFFQGFLRFFEGVPFENGGLPLFGPHPGLKRVRNIIYRVNGSGCVLFSLPPSRTVASPARRGEQPKTCGVRRRGRAAPSLVTARRWAGPHVQTDCVPRGVGAGAGVRLPALGMPRNMYQSADWCINSEGSPGPGLQVRCGAADLSRKGQPGQRHDDDGQQHRPGQGASLCLYAIR